MLFSLLFIDLINRTTSNAATQGYVKSLEISLKSVYLKVEENKKITYKIKTRRSSTKKVIVKVENPKIMKVTLKKIGLLLKGKSREKQS